MEYTTPYTMSQKEITKSIRKYFELNGYVYLEHTNIYEMQV